MKNTTTWALKRRPSLARMSGRIRIIEAPVVPMTLAIAAPKARIALLTSGEPLSEPLTDDAARGGEEREQHEDEGQIFERQLCARPPRSHVEVLDVDETGERQQLPKRRPPSRNGYATIP